MIFIQPTLYNYNHITLMHEYATQKDVKLIISKNGVLHVERVICPDCDCLCNYNGSNKTGNIMSRSIDAFFKKGQQCCPICGRTYQIEYGYFFRDTKFPRNLEFYWRRGQRISL